MVTNASDKEVKDSFRAEWGIVTKASVLKTIAMPAASTITKALDVYQTALRKPSWTVWSSTTPARCAATARQAP